MKSYLKFIGVIELVVWCVGMVLYIIFMISVLSSLGSTPSITIIFPYIFGLICLLVFGPAIGVLSIAVSSLIEARECTISESFSNGDTVYLEENMVPYKYMNIKKGTPCVVKEKGEFKSRVTFDYEGMEYTAVFPNDVLSK